MIGSVRGCCCCCCCCWNATSSGRSSNNLETTTLTRTNNAAAAAPTNAWCWYCSYSSGRSSSRHWLLLIGFLLLACYAMTFDVSVIQERGILPDHVTNLINRTNKLLRTTRPTNSSSSSSIRFSSNPSSPGDDRNQHSSRPAQQSSAPFRLPPALVDTAQAHARVVDRGGLDIARLDHFDSGRWIRSNDVNVFEHEKEDQYAAFAANTKEEEYWGYHDAYDPLLGIVSHVVTDMKPNCNVFYEQHWPNDDPVPGDMMDTIQYLASGYYRDTYMYSHYPATSSADTDHHAATTTSRLEQVVIKRQKFALPLSRQRQLKVRNEALAMELLTSSPRITRAYGHCAFSLMVETAMQGIARTIVPYYKDFQNYPGVLPQKNLDYHPEVLAYNNLTATEKLDYALALTESMADIHGLPTGPLVLMDVSLDQWLVTADGRVVLNDFDNSIFLRWLVTEQSYAPVWTAPVGVYKSPEEAVTDSSTVPLLETTDLWKMGAVLYTILTGLQPYYNELHEERLDVMNDMLKAGTPPYVDPRYASHSFIEGRLVDIMMQCFRLDPNDRVDIFQVVQWLRETERLSLAEFDHDGDRS
jgi:serine/threonine protein kinase